MTTSSNTSNDLEKHNAVDVIDMDNHDTLNTDNRDTLNTENHDTLDTEKRPPATETTADAFESPLQQASQASEWSSPEDPENPLNWSIAKKSYQSAIPSVYCFTVYVKDTPVTWTS